MSALHVVYLVTIAIAVVAGLLALARMRQGPTLLDRTVASDVLTAALIGLLSVMVVGWSRSDLGVLLVILAVSAFMTAVVVARFAAKEDFLSSLVLSRAQAARQVRERQAAAEAAEEAELEAAELEATDEVVRSGAGVGADGAAGADLGSGATTRSAGAVATGREEPE